MSNVIKVKDTIVPTYILLKGATVEELHEKFTEENEGNNLSCLCMTSEGVFTYKVNSAMKAFCQGKANKIEGLMKPEGLIWWNGSKIPFKMFQEIQRFFLDIYNEHKTEAAVVLFYHFEKKEWQVIYPIQMGLNGAHVKYLITTEGNDPLINRAKAYCKDNKEAQEEWNRVESLRKKFLNEGYRIFGTIHSHCDFSAFHSGVDDNDEFGFDGIHITIGNLLSGVTYAQRIISNQSYFKFDDISELVDLEGHTIEELKDVSNASSIFSFTKARCFIEKCNYTDFGFGGGYQLQGRGYWKGDTSSWYRNRSYDDYEIDDTEMLKLRTTKKNSSGLYLPKVIQDKIDEEKNQVDTDTVFIDGEEVVIFLEDAEEKEQYYTGKIIAQCTILPNYYYVETENHPFPLYIIQDKIYYPSELVAENAKTDTQDEERIWWE